MNMTCPKCGAGSASTARFCHECGCSLDATMTQGRTVVMTPTRVERTQTVPFDARTIVERARTGFGDPTRIVGRATAVAQVRDQREDTLLVLDRSGSMGEEFDAGVNKLQAAIRASVNLVLGKHGIDPGDRIGIINFNQSANVLLNLCPIGTDKRTIIQTLQSITSSGGTDINEGLVAAVDRLDWSRRDVVRRVVLLTDGHGGHPLGTASHLKGRGVVIDVIAVGSTPSKVNEKLLRKIASVVEGETRYRFIKDQQTLLDHYTQLANKTATGA